MTRPANTSRIEVALTRDGFALDFEIEWTDPVLVLFGPSGSGKSTVLECALGLHPGAPGRIELDGRCLDDPTSGKRLSIQERQLGWVPQAPTLFPHLDVEANLRFGLRRAGAEGEATLAHAIQVLELGPLLGRDVDDLSGGERSRVAIGRALASSPRCLLLDEPLASLDLPLRARVLPYLLRVRDAFDIPIIYVTHDPDEAMLLGGTLGVIEAGRRVAQGPAREVLWSRAVLPLSQALGIENVLDARALESDRGDESTIETPAGLRLVVPWPIPAGTALCLGLPAEDILIAREEPRGLSARNVLRASVTRCEARDSEVLVYLDAGEPLVAKLTAGAVQRLALEPGQVVFAIVKAHALKRLS
jgi:molybdate transport system ATP-binding protein